MMKKRKYTRPRQRMAMKLPREKRRNQFNDIRTDLAVEEKESFPGDGGEIQGVALREWYEDDQQIKLTEVKILNERGARAMGKEKGTYLTIEAKDIDQKGSAYREMIADELAVQIGKLAKNTDGGILVVGLGNLYVTPDSLGPRVLEHLHVTRHLDGQYGQGFLKSHQMISISGIAPGVMAQTGMETAEILKGIVAETKPRLVIAIDALAARSVHRLGCTIQLSDTGISPGSGVGNHRSGLTRESLGVPVLAIGVPTVVGAAAIVQDTIDALIKAMEEGKKTKAAGEYLKGLGNQDQYNLIRELIEPEFGPMFVTPPDIDERIDQLSKVIANAIEQAFLPESEQS